MMKLLSLEFFVAVLFIIDLFMIFLLVLFVKRVSRVSRIRVEGDGEEMEAQYLMETASDASALAASGAAREVTAALEPLMKASRDAALEFDQLIREKKKISKDLNDALDSKIISINLLLSRANSLQKQLEEQQFRFARSGPVRPEPLPAEPSVLDQQNRIIDLYYQKVDIDTIAEQLSIPKGEVQLVIDLKEKFVAMEQAQ